QAVHLIQAGLQFRRRLTGPRFAPPRGRPLGPLDDPILLGPPCVVPVHPDTQADQPERQLGGEVATRTPRPAVVDAKAAGQSTGGAFAPMVRCGRAPLGGAARGSGQLPTWDALGAASRRSAPARRARPRWPSGRGNLGGCRRGRGAETAGGAGARWSPTNPTT